MLLCESVDNILTDRVLNNELSRADLKAKSDKPVAHIKGDKALQYLVLDKFA